MHFYAKMFVNKVKSPEKYKSYKIQKSQQPSAKRAEHFDVQAAKTAQNRHTNIKVHAQ